jgi:hypothetical protein
MYALWLKGGVSRDTIISGEAMIFIAPGKTREK